MSGLRSIPVSPDCLLRIGFPGSAGLFDKTVSVARIKAARAAIDASCEDVILVARTEGLLLDPTSLNVVIDKLVAFAEAGADCLYAPGVAGKREIATMVRAVAPKPLNVLVMGPGLSLSELAELGVRRVSVGGALAQVAWGAAQAAAQAIKDGVSTSWKRGRRARNSMGYLLTSFETEAPNLTLRGHSAPMSLACGR